MRVSKLTVFALTPRYSKPGPNIKFSDEVTSVKDCAMNLKRSGINIIIALGHAGIEIDKKIAKEVDDIDIVIGGHTNTFLYSGQCSNVDLIVAITYYRFKCGKLFILVLLCPLFIVDTHPGSL